MEGVLQNQRQLVKVNFKCTRNPFRVLRVFRVIRDSDDRVTKTLHSRIVYM